MKYLLALSRCLLNELDNTYELESNVIQEAIPTIQSNQIIII